MLLLHILGEKPKGGKMNLVTQNMKKIGGKIRKGVMDFWNDESGMGTVEVILIIVGICIADKSRILCGNFRCI